MAVAAPPAQSIPANQSLYIQNLSEKLQKEDLRRELYMLFSTYGPVIDVTALKTKKMRGQAHVLFKDTHSATQAMRSCRGLEFFGRGMVISYSKNRSNTLSKLTGTFAAPSQPNTTTSQAGQSTLLSQPPSSFAAPPGSSIPPPPSGLPQPPQGLPSAPPSGLPPPPAALPGPPTSLPAPPKANGALSAPEREMEDVASPQGVKRAREESEDGGSEDEEDAPMEEDDEEEGGEMEMSDED